MRNIAPSTRRWAFTKAGESLPISLRLWQRRFDQNLCRTFRLLHPAKRFTPPNVPRLRTCVRMSIYNAELSAGSLLPLESKRIAVLLLSTPDDAAWRHALEVDNILQKKTPATARRQATLIRKRLMTLDGSAWKEIAGSGNEVARQLLLASAVKHSQLLGDFMLNVYANRQRRLEPALAPGDWHDFLAECAHRDPAVAAWSDSTKAKLFQVIVRILAEAKYLESARSMKLTPQSLHPDVRHYLTARHETYVLDCLERAT